MSHYLYVTGEIFSLILEIKKVKFRDVKSVAKDCTASTYKPGTKPRVSNSWCNLPHFVKWMGIKALRYVSMPFSTLERCDHHWKFQLINYKTCVYITAYLHLPFKSYVSFTNLVEKWSCNGSPLYCVTTHPVQIFLGWLLLFGVLRQRSPWPTTCLQAIELLAFDRSVFLRLFPMVTDVPGGWCPMYIPLLLQWAVSTSTVASSEWHI